MTRKGLLRTLLAIRLCYAGQYNTARWLLTRRQKITDTREAWLMRQIAWTRAVGALDDSMNAFRLCAQISREHSAAHKAIQSQSIAYLKERDGKEFVF